MWGQFAYNLGRTMVGAGGCYAASEMFKKGADKVSKTETFKKATNYFENRRNNNAGK